MVLLGARTTAGLLCAECVRGCMRAHTFLSPPSFAPMHTRQPHARCFDPGSAIRLGREGAGVAPAFKQARR